MTWGKGFFRAWVVVALLWVGLALLMSKPQTYLGLWRAPKYEIELGSGQKITLDTALSHEDLADALDAELKREATRPGGKVSSTSRDDILTAINARYSSPGDQAQQAWLVTLLPPVGLLILGAAIGWVLSGFRRA